MSETVDVSFEVVDELAGRVYREADSVVCHPDDVSPRPATQVTVDLTGGEGMVTLEPGVWEFEIVEETYPIPIGRRDHTVEHGFDHDHIALAVRPYSLNVQLMESPGQEPATQAEVTATTDIVRESSQKRTDSDGHVQFEVPRSASTVEFAAEVEGFQPVESEYSVDQANKGVTLSLKRSYSLSTSQQERIADLRDRIDGLSDASGRDTAIPQYYGTVLTSVLDLVEDVESNPEQLGGDAPPESAVEAILGAVDTGIDAVDDAMSERRNVDLFRACESLSSAGAEWRGAASLDALAERIAQVERESGSGSEILDERLAETDRFLQRKWSEVAEMAPARKLHDRIKASQQGLDDSGDTLRVAVQGYVTTCLLDAIEELFEHEDLIARLNNITY